MWRFLAGAASGLLLVAAGVFLFNGYAAGTSPLPGKAPRPGPSGRSAAASVPAATAQTREQKRFDRYDKDRDGIITRDEYLVSRHKAFAKLDTDHDGKLSFDEWAITTETKFAKADADRSGTLNAAEFATTAVHHKPKPKPVCPPSS